MAGSTIPGRIVRVAALLVLAVGLLEFALQLNGQSLAPELLALSVPKLEVAMNEALKRGDDLFWLLPAAGYAARAGSAGDRLLPLFIQAIDAKPMAPNERSWVQTSIDQIEERQFQRLR